MSNADIALLERWLKQGDPEAFKTVALRYAGMVYSTCRRVLRNHSDAEEVAQDCFEALASGRAKPTTSLGPWLHRVATNRALKRLSSESHRKAREKAFAERALRADREAGWDDIYEHVDNAINRLPDRFRRPIVAHFLENETHDAIAQTLGVSRQTVTYRIAKGVELIRAALKRGGVTITAATLAGLLSANTSEAAPAGLVAGVGKLALAGPSIVSSGIPLTFIKAVLVVGVVAATAVLGTKALNPASTPRMEVVRLTPAVETIPANSASPSATPSEANESGRVADTPVDPNSAAGSPAGAGAAGTVCGRVYDSDTQTPIAGVWIRTIAARELIEVETDASGYYQFSGLDKGAHKLNRAVGKVSIDGKVSPDREPLEGYPMPQDRDAVTVYLEESTGVTGADFPLRKGLPITGRVLDAAGKPVEGVTVTSEPLNDSRISSTGGAFALWGYSEGAQVRLRAVRRERDENVSAAAGATKLRRVGEDGIHDVALVVDLLGEITGQVVDAEGRPAPNVRVTAEPATPPPADRERPTFFGGTGSDSNGMYRLRELPPATYRLRAEGSSGSDALETVESTSRLVELGAGSRVHDVRLVYTGVLQPPHGINAGSLMISGRVTSETGAPVADVNINASNHDMNINSHGTTSTAADGTFSVNGLVEGAYSVRGWNWEYQTINLQDVPAGTKNLNVRLVRRLQEGITVRVVDAADGKPLTDYELNVQLARAAADMPPSSPELARRSTAPVHSAGDDGASAAMEWVWSHTPGTRVHDRGGKFVSDSVDAGTYVIAAQAPGFGIATGHVEVGPDANTRGELELRLQPEARIEGIAVDDLGHPLDGIGIYAGHHRRATLASESVRSSLLVTHSDANGAFAIGGLPGGPFALTACGADRPSACATVSLEAGKTATPRIVLRAGATLRVAVAVDGAPRQNAMVTVDTADASSLTVQTQYDGTYLLEGMESGKVVVDVSLTPGSMDSRTLRRQGSVSAGQTTTLSVDFPAEAESLTGSVMLDGATPENASVVLTVTNLAGEREGIYLPPFENGRFKFAAPPAGDTVARVSASRGDEARTRIVRFRLEPGKPHVLDVNFEGGGVLHGTVTGVRDDEICVVLVVLGEIAPHEKPEEFLDGHRGSRMGCTPLKPDGTFHIEGLESLTYTVIAFAMSNEPRDKGTLPARMRKTLQPVSVSEGQVKDIVLSIE